MFFSPKGKVLLVLGILLLTAIGFPSLIFAETDYSGGINFSGAGGDNIRLTEPSFSGQGICWTVSTEETGTTVPFALGGTPYVYAGAHVNDFGSSPRILTQISNMLTAGMPDNSTWYSTFYTGYNGSTCSSRAGFAKVNITNGVGLLSPYYAQIKNTSGGTSLLYAGPSTSSTTIKRLPEDWIVYVASTTDLTNTAITANGYNWYKVIDPTDNVSGWMQGKNATSSEEYLPFNGNQQIAFQATSTDIISASTTRASLILKAIDHYYNDATSTYSLYSSNDGTNNLSIFNTRGYPKKVIWGIVSQESGGIDFDNQYVTYDYGHGIMQLTFNAWYYEHYYSESSATWDNRGAGSKVTIFPCASISTSAYVDCYTGAGTGNGSLKPYKAYAGNSSNPTYKQYTNTEQSIYANLKDGLRILQDKYNNNLECDTTPGSLTINSVSYSCLDREIILTTAQYNGTSTYLAAVANKLDNIDDDFPGQSASDLSDLISKFNSASADSVYVQLHSPGDLRIQDSKGRIVGLVDGKVKKELPFSTYDRKAKLAQIFFPGSEDLTYKVVGTDKGVYGLDIIINSGDDNYEFETKNMSMVPGQVDTYKVDKVLLQRGENGVTVQIDNDGDSIIDKEVKLPAKVKKNVDIIYKKIPKEINFTPAPSNIPPTTNQITTATITPKVISPRSVYPTSALPSSTPVVLPEEGMTLMR